MRDDSAVVEEYERLAPCYDSRWHGYVEASVRETLARLELEGVRRLLDIGCGTGVLLEAVARTAAGAGLVSSAGPRATGPRDRILAGIDVSPGMLRVARGRLAEPVQLVCARGERLPFVDASFDAVVSSSALHFFREPRRALAEIRRVLRPGGRLALTDWCGDYATCRALDFWLRLTDAAHFRVYGASELRRMLEHAGFENVGIDRYRVDWFWGLMTASAG